MFPRVVVFDLDGTWWKPDMFKLWGGGGAPFKRIPNTDSAMLDKGGNTVELTGDSMRLISELYHWSQHRHVPSANGNLTLTKRTPDQPLPFVVAAASRTDEPKWARELLDLFHTRPFPFDKPVIFQDGQQQQKETDEAIFITQPLDLDKQNIVPFSTVLGDLAELYKDPKKTHMSNILHKIKHSKIEFSSAVLPNNNKDDQTIVIPPLFAAALPEGVTVCPDTGVVSFSKDLDESVKNQLLEDDKAPISYKDYVYFDNEPERVADMEEINISAMCVPEPEGLTMKKWEAALKKWRKEQRPVKNTSK